MKIREIEEKDNKRVEEIIRTCLIEFGGNKKGTAWEDPYLGRFSEVYSNEKSKYFVAEENGVVVGGGGIGPLEGEVRVCELQKMYVLKEYRGLGVANRILEAAIEFASKYYDKCYLETLDNMKRSHAFYCKNGFEKTNNQMGSTGHNSCTCYFIKNLR